MSDEITPEAVRAMVRDEVAREMKTASAEMRLVVREEIAKAMVNGWSEYRVAVTQSLESLDRDGKELTHKVDVLANAMASTQTELKNRATIWGAIAVIIAAAIAAAEGLLIRGLG